jgi:hypothetical protein
MFHLIQKYFNIILKRHVLNSIEAYADFICNLDQEFFYVQKSHFLKKLESLGWQKIGSGAYSVVLITPCKKYVLRIGIAGDKGYTSNAYNAICDPENPHYCNIYMLFFGLNSKFSFTFMEQLKPLNSAPLKFQELHQSSVQTLLAIHRNGNPSLLDIHPEPLQKTLMQIACTAYDNSVSLDLHTGNVMVRNNRDLVFTDPLN